PARARHDRHDLGPARAEEDDRTTAAAHARSAGARDGRQRRRRAGRVIGKRGGAARLSGLTYPQLLSELFPRLTGGIRWGLERTRRMLAAVGDPHLTF